MPQASATALHAEPALKAAHTKRRSTAVEKRKKTTRPKALSSTDSDYCESLSETSSPTLTCLTKEEINALPICAYEGEICLVRTPEELATALQHLKKETILGFDTETRPNFTRGQSSLPALIQLAGVHVVYLIQLTALPFSQDLATILANPDIIKAGVGIRDDMKALTKLHSFEPEGMEDLATLATRKGIKAQGLRTLAANLLGFRISKSAQCSNWEAPHLSPRQIRYAATDAWVGRELYLRLK